jgi:hypothetical protein
MSVCEASASIVVRMIPTRARREDKPPRPSVRHLRLRALSGVLLLATALLGATTIAAAESPASRPSIPAPSFLPVTVSASIATVASSGTATPDPARPIADYAARRDDLGGQPMRPEVDTPSPTAESVRRERIRARGDATWYCLNGVSACHRDRGSGMYAAAGPELRVGDWRGRKVSVCRGDDCVRVTLIDWCACPGDRVIDLYGDAFRELASLSTGIVPVTVRW